MADSSDRLPTALLFTSGEASVHMEVTEDAAGLHLTVRGPGLAVASHDFADGAALLAFTRQQEEELRSKGFQLQAFAERRTSRGQGGGKGRAERRSDR